ncbi:MAG: sensor histidine kinase [Parasporobacterium sp.]|nr:sensor histidine kinase [Parasporobacterium sp.]
MNVIPAAYEFSIFWFFSGFVMFAPHFVCTFLLEKRRFFILRSVIGVLLFAVAAFLTCYTDQWNERYYLLLHLAGALYLAFCSRCSFKMIVYFNIWCIVLYYFVFQIHFLLNALLKINGNVGLLYLSKVAALIAMVILEIILLRSILVKNVFRLPASQVMIAALISIAIIAFNTITFATSPAEGYTRYIFQVFSMLCNLLALYLQAVAFYSQEKKYETDYIRHIWRMSKKDHELKAEYIDLINHKYHDLKHEIRALRQLPAAERDACLDRLEESVDHFGNLFQTGNELLDAILNDVRRHCEKEKIMFSCIVNCGNIDFMDVVDLSILLGNLLDNAMEAAVRLPEGNRVIDLKMLMDDNFLRITQKNTYAGELNITSDGLVSSKQENGYHGFGTQSMKYIIEKYNGQMALDAEDGVFSLHVIIPVAAAFRQEQV